jgi:cytochrome P450
VIFEGLRIHPPNFLLLSKQVPPEGDTLDGKFVPGGTKIAQNIWSIVRCKATFGEDADLSPPERRLEVTEEKRAEMERVTELSFGHGRWMCAGKTVAIMELNKIFVEVCHMTALRYSIHLTRLAAPS